MASCREVVLHASGAETASGSQVMQSDRMKSGVFWLDVTACTGGADTLDVKIQDGPDGTIWTDVTGLTFTQATAATTERKAASQLGPYLKAVWTVGAGATATFSLKGHLDEA